MLSIIQLPNTNIVEIPCRIPREALFLDLLFRIERGITETTKTLHR